MQQSPFEENNSPVLGLIKLYENNHSQSLAKISQQHRLPLVLLGSLIQNDKYTSELETLMLSVSKFATHYLLDIYPTLPTSLQFLAFPKSTDIQENPYLPIDFDTCTPEGYESQLRQQPYFDYQRELQFAVSQIQNEHELARLLRHFRQQKVIELIVLQLQPLLFNNTQSEVFISLSEINTQKILVQLSNLADSIISVANNWLYERCVVEMGQPQDANGNPQPLVIIAMGKLGGNELNFSSDVDLIFTYPESGETYIDPQHGNKPNLKPKDNSVFFLRLAQRLIKTLDQITEDGFVYRVDMRLRPLGDSGPLVTTYSALEDYYQEQGRDWERYALIKARVISDCDERFKSQLNKLLKPFIYRRYIDFSVLNSIRSMKLMIQQEVMRKEQGLDIKLSAGGIREIEFTIQAIQLIYGGRIPALRTVSLLDALNQIQLHNLLPVEQINLLRGNYLFLRRCENILQSFNDQQTQLLPADQNDLLRLAFLMGFNSSHELSLVLNQKMLQVRQIFNEVIRDDEFPEGNNLSVLSTVSNNNRQSPQVQFSPNLDIANNQQFTYQDAQLFWTHLLQSNEVETHLPLLHNTTLSNESKLSLIGKLRGFALELSKRTVGPRGRIAFDKLMPSLIFMLIQSDSDKVIEIFERLFLILIRLASRTIYLELLNENPPALDQLIKLCRSSSFIAERLAKYPMLLGELLDSKSLYQPIEPSDYPKELAQFMLRISESDEEVWLDTLCQFKQIQQLRIAAADITGILSIMKVSDHLTALAEAIIDAVTEMAWRTLSKKYGIPEHLDWDNSQDKGLLIIAYGKLGGWELAYRSDLDLVFVMNNKSGTSTNGDKTIDSSLFYLRLAQRIIHLLSSRTNSGMLYEVDTRLRPEGAAGLLVSDISTYCEYQQQRAWIWEHQALVRARAIYGDDTLKERFNNLRTQVLMQVRQVDSLRRSIIDMRNKMVSHISAVSSDIFNLKHDVGGITDIEFLAQYIVLAFAHKDSHLAKWQDTVRIFDAAGELGILDKKYVDLLKQIYTQMRNAIHKLALQRLPPEVSRIDFAIEIKEINTMWQKMILSD